MANIFNSITKSGQYPRQWVKESVTPIPKVPNVESEDDLRNISLTADLSKDYENFIADWLEPYLILLDQGQFGGRKKHSIVHYLVLLLHFIISNTDINDNISRAVVIALCDYSKGFNRINHMNLIIRLSDWGVPGWLLKVLISYLTERTMILKYNGAESDPQSLPGGSIQGSLVGILLFIIELSDAGMPVPP